MVRRNQRKFLKDLESYLVKFVSPGISQWYAILRFEFEFKFEARKKIGTLHEDSVKCDFMSYTNLYRASQKDASVEGSVEMSRKKRC